VGDENGGRIKEKVSILSYKMPAKLAGAGSRCIMISGREYVS